MFGKLMKYECKSCMRVFLPLWGAIIALGIINGLTLGFETKLQNPILSFLVYILPAILMVALSFSMFIVAFVLIIRRFYYGLLGEGGYLAFSLPVTTAQHISAKLLTALIMVVGCILAGFLASVILFSIRGYLNDAQQILRTLREQLSGYQHLGIVIMELVAFFLLMSSFIILRLYAGMAVGHLFIKHRAAWSVLAVVVMGWIFNFISAKIAEFAFRHTEGHISISTARQFFDLMPKGLGIALLFLLIGNVILWAVTHLILNRKLNIL